MWESTASASYSHCARRKKKCQGRRQTQLIIFQTTRSEGSEGAVKSNVLFMSLVSGSSSVHRNGNWMLPTRDILPTVIFFLCSVDDKEKQQQEQPMLGDNLFSNLSIYLLALRSLRYWVMKNCFSGANLFRTKRFIVVWRFRTFTSFSLF